LKGVKFRHHLFNRKVYLKKRSRTISLGRYYYPSVLKTKILNENDTEEKTNTYVDSLEHHIEKDIKRRAEQIKEYPALYYDLRKEESPSYIHIRGDLLLLQLPNFEFMGPCFSKMILSPEEEYIAKKILKFSHYSKNFI